MYIEQLQAQQQQQAQNQYAGQLNMFRGQNAQQTMADAQRQSDMVKFYTQLGFDEQQAQLLANQQIDQMNAEVWWQQLGFKSEKDALDAKRTADANARTNSQIDAGISSVTGGLASLGSS
jgi:predicted CoA-binding protein